MFRTLGPRNIADQLAHLHNVRVTWREVMAPGAAKGLRKMGKDGVTKDAVRVGPERCAGISGGRWRFADNCWRTKGIIAGKFYCTSSTPRWPWNRRFDRGYGSGGSDSGLSV
jgi:hypothetical protein